MNDDVQHLASLAWSVADLLRGNYKQSEYGKVILPFIVLRRLECVLKPTRGEVTRLVGQCDNGEIIPDALPHSTSSHSSFNASNLTLSAILEDPQNTARNLKLYLEAFSGSAREILDGFDFDLQVRKLQEAGLLNQVVHHFSELDLRPDAVTDHRMSLLFEELTRRLASHSEDTFGEYSTPRDVTRLIVNLLIPSGTDTAVLPADRTVMDPACGSGGMLSAAQEHLEALNPDVTVEAYGQETNAQSWAICAANFLMKGVDPENVVLGNTLANDKHAARKFDYLVCNPPFGLGWQFERANIEHEYRNLGAAGRFGAGLPRISDSSLLFLQHMISKMKPVDSDGTGGSRVAIIFNSSPLSSGAAGSGESEIRRWILENDLLEGVVALPRQLFYNTGIPTYLWILTNRRTGHSKNTVILLDARDEWQKMRKSLGHKRREIGAEQVRAITERFERAFEVARDPEHPQYTKVKVLSNADFGYQRITVEQPLRLRFEVNTRALSNLTAARTVQKLTNGEQFVSAVRTLLGSSWGTKAQALAAIKKALGTACLGWPTGAPLEKAIRDAISVRDPTGEVQHVKGVTEPDANLREFRRVPLGEDVDDYFAREIRPNYPDAWVDSAKTRIGYEIKAELFFSTTLKATFEPLEKFCRLETKRIALKSIDTREDESQDVGSYLNEKLRHLRMQDLHTVDFAAELPHAPGGVGSLTPCGGGDIVGKPGDWRLLPPSFGSAVTRLTVLHPREPQTGGAISEWLNSPAAIEQVPAGQDIIRLPVPAEVIQVGEFNGLLEQVQAARHKLRIATTGLLPNAFSGTDANIQELRRSLRATIGEAQLIGGLAQTLEDPVSRAEWSYPFHVAALARRYRISSIAPSTHPAERMDSLLKLGEGIARTLGIVALAELAKRDKEEFLKTLRQRFGSGATFGTWTTILGWQGGTQGWTVLDPYALGEAHSLLKRIKDFRNSGSAHAHGVREMHEIGDAADELEQLVLLTLRSVSWLSAMHWDWIERSEYLDTASYNLVKQRLRGSHPAWEPLEESSQHPLKPKHIYVGNGAAGAPLDIWPLASVEICMECNVRELFLVNKMGHGTLELKSLRDHSIEIPYPNL